jgi:NTP pyrophosphatase (non-canonical NTP hydrolase)
VDVVNNLPEQMANKFSRRDQLLKLIEELGECTAAVSRYYAYLYYDGSFKTEKDLKQNFVDEIIDVEFLFAQMRYYFDGFEEAEERNNAEVKARFFND